MKEIKREGVGRKRVKEKKWIKEEKRNRIKKEKTER